MASAVAVMVTVEELQIDAGKMVARVDDSEVSLPISAMFLDCLNHKPGSIVSIDDTVTGELILATREWSLVYLAHSANRLPLVVSTSRVSFPTPVAAAAKAA